MAASSHQVPLPLQQHLLLLQPQLPVLPLEAVSSRPAAGCLLTYAYLSDTAMLCLLEFLKCQNSCPLVCMDALCVSYQSSSNSSGNLHNLADSLDC